jgi:hypothetical protein
MMLNHSSRCNPFPITIITEFAKRRTKEAQMLCALSEATECELPDCSLHTGEPFPIFQV